MRDTAKHPKGRLLFLAGLMLASYPLVADRLAAQAQGGAATASQARA